MKVKELIELLRQENQDLTVCVDGYEGGVTESISVYRTPVLLDKNEEWYYGEHEEIWAGEDDPERKGVIVLLLSRTPRPSVL